MLRQIHLLETVDKVGMQPKRTKNRIPIQKKLYSAPLDNH
jgi:hypothetical protein